MQPTNPTDAATDMTAPPAAATVGTFDGVHRGHAVVLRTLAAEARRRGLQPMVITFDAHPLSVIAPERAPRTLMSASEKLAMLTRFDVTPPLEVRMLHFTPGMMGLTAHDWMRHLRDTLGVRLIVIGYDNTFGSDGRAMQPEQYVALGRELGLEVVVAPVVEGCSSSRARRAVAGGDMKLAAEILGRPFSLGGHVGRGDRIGRTLGFPTANLMLPDLDSRLLPPNGVYLSRTRLHDGRLYDSVTNIGVRPTIEGHPEMRIETHLLDFDEDIYDTDIRVCLLERMRPERKFASRDELSRAIAADKEDRKSVV